MVVAEGGEYLDKDGKPAFNSEAGVRALDWFVNLYKAKAVPAGTTNYLWDDLGQGFASGTIAINLDWPGWAGFFNDPKSSKVAGNVGVKVQPKGSSGKRTGWSGHHGFSVTESCANKEAAASLVWFLTNEDSQKLEAAAGPLPTRTAVWDWDIEQAEGRPLQEGSADRLPGSGAERLPGAADAAMDRDLQRRLSGAAGGHPRRQDVEAGARRRRRQGDADPRRTPASSELAAPRRQRCPSAGAALRLHAEQQVVATPLPRQLSQVGARSGSRMPSPVEQA